MLLENYLFLLQLALSRDVVLLSLLKAQLEMVVVKNRFVVRFMQIVDLS